MKNSMKTYHKHTGVLDFIRSQDTQLIRLGLTYLQMLLTQVPEVSYTNCNVRLL